MKKVSLLMLALLSLASTACNAKTLEEKGKEKSVVCAACHGDKGVSKMPIYPNLAGQKKPYLEMALKAYRDQSRKGLQAEAMYAIAAQLSDEDIKAIAAYYSAINKK